MRLSPEATRVFEIRNDFETYAQSCLKIVNKAGKLIPFTMNKAQRYLHDRAQDQLERTGKIRIICIKGRQQGISTYISGRFYWQASGEFGQRFIILTHLMEATDNLFNMVKRYHDNVPDALRPKTKSDNAKELYFDGLKTRYSVATARSRGTGRSATAQRFHGSEVAFWENGEKHMAGIGQIVPFEDGTEIFLESTANGLGNMFHTMVMNALAGKGDYEVVFIPWFWQEEYQRPVPDGIDFEEDELEYQAIFGITPQQLYWRRIKIVDEFSNDVGLFDQEYPATLAMAFLAGASRALIRPAVVARAVANDTADDSIEALILGVDPAEYGDDDTSAVLRRGHKLIKRWSWSKEGNAQIAGRIGRIIDKYERKGDPIDAVAIDVTGVGTGVEAFLTDQNYQNIYRVHNGEKAIESEKYRNRGAECWGLMKDWLEDGTRPADIPAGAVLLQAELSSRSYTYDAGRRLVLQSKEQMRAKGIKSPNEADALSLTFAVSAQPKSKRKRETLEDKLRRLSKQYRGGGSPGMSA